ncbi:hypothetical protein V8G54_002796 [Vigna mungo]|uniref:Nucleoside diphosphate kinase n=1 Tax=Vigna mungo TaxID=3915 RepID=A0AAQ3PAZ5_VIGMU
MQEAHRYRRRRLKRILFRAQQSRRSQEDGLTGLQICFKSREEPIGNVNGLNLDVLCFAETKNEYSFSQKDVRHGRSGSGSGSASSWISGAIALPAAGLEEEPHPLLLNSSSCGFRDLFNINNTIFGSTYMFQDQEVHAAELERTFIAIKPDGVQRGLISEIISRFERKGYKLVGIKVVIPSKDFAKQHYHDLKERPFFDGLCDFLSSGPVIAMVWEGQGVISYGRKLIGATDPQKSEPGTIRGDLAVVVGRNIIHGSDGPETAKDEINLWFKPEELVSFTSNAEKWVYGAN